MKVGRLQSGSVALTEEPDPVAGPGEVVVRLAACGVCGTDLEKLRGRYQSTGRIGHEPVGAIHSVGSGVPGLRAGDRVFVHHHVPCYTCEVCRKGDLTFCPTYSSTNIDPGGFAEMFRVPAENVSRGAILPLDPSIGWEVGTLLEPAGCALTALRRVGFKSGDSVFIVGLGPVGILYGAIARALGASWVGGAEIAPLRRAAAMRAGFAMALDPRDAPELDRQVHAATGGRGVDLAVAATGAPPAIALAARLPRRAGTMNVFGLPEAGRSLDADLQELYLRGTRIVPTYATTDHEIRAVHAMLVGRNLDFSGLVTHRVPLERLAEAFDLAGRPDTAVKVAVTGPAFSG
ncbi:MAG: alcohol dehydrogenase catalytic domain-containing protein [Thermoplasmata archaeon]|nr:alcohol dehydrogenase catalytic domain-containing protein [Thermoplasmata archaeon]MCI4329556.1 alcohol dehydrogenase catalytic domain-containing protein [Thermoplasmata archaeon]MCI4332875.1 alcohol dehydrogenase catalytic domain-containing protein [Thermoplasmata archaeon]MCI4361161.1 alcohol dehydrogenase catalytic domain-containing protein [Thermoplasmata archaeon]